MTDKKGASTGRALLANGMARCTNVASSLVDATVVAGIRCQEVGDGV